MPNSPSTGADRPRRFYRTASAGARDGRWVVLLDDRAAKTPDGAPLAAPTRALAELLAAEWEAQVEQVERASMPANRLAATVIDRTAAAGAGVALEVARYAGSDVLCYLADGPEALVEAQTTQWAPLRTWASTALGVDLRAVTGVIHAPQGEAALARVEALVAGLEPFTQAGVAFAAPLFGSAVLALAVQRGRLDALGAFELSRLDEAFQQARWGVDAEAAERTAVLRQEAALIGRWFQALRPET